MSHDAIFRIVLAGLASFQFISHMMHRSKSSTARSIGGFGEIAVIVTACLWTACLVGYVSGFNWFHAGVSLPQWLRWFGVAVMVACIPMSIWTYRTLGVHFSSKLQLLDDHRLVTAGPYRLIRHPMYATLISCASATILISESFAVTVTANLLIAAILCRIDKEDMLLRQRFGEHHKLYMERTGAIIPRILPCS